MGLPAPTCSAAGVDYDVRVHTPYCSYEEFNFTIPVGSTTGDCYDRFLVRNEEMGKVLISSEQAAKSAVIQGR